MLLRTIVAVALSLCTAGFLLGEIEDETAVTFNNQVIRIFQESCQACHRPGEIGPMSLMSYREARPWAKAIRKAVAERTMPPWHADARPGTFIGDLSLSPQQIDAIVSWVDAGAPEGDASDLPEPRGFTAGEWKNGDPDLVLEMNESHILPGTVRDEYRCFVLPATFATDAWYEIAEVRPGNSKVVHHAVAFGDAAVRAAAHFAEARDESGFLCGMGDSGMAVIRGAPMLGVWVPGTAPVPLDEIAGDGVAFHIPAGTTIVLQLHYHNTTGEDQEDRSAVALYLARETVRRRPQQGLMNISDLHIPAGEARVEHSLRWTAPEDVSLLQVFPHMHYLGVDMSLAATFPDGRREEIFGLSSYDFNWQRTYRYREPVSLPAGTVLEMTAVHDNSDSNPNQQFTPPRDISFGQSTDDEMAAIIFHYTRDGEQAAVEPARPELRALDSSAKAEVKVRGENGGK